MPQLWAKAPRGAGQPGDADSLPAGSTEQTIPASPAVHLANCGAVWQSPLCSNACGKLLRAQQAWKPWVPICQPGKLWAAEEPRLPAPSGWSWEAGRASHRSLPGVPASLAGAGEPQMLPEPLSYFRKSTSGGGSLAHQEITILQAAFAKISLNHISSKDVAARHSAGWCTLQAHGHAPAELSEGTKNCL